MQKPQQNTDHYQSAYKKQLLMLENVYGLGKLAQHDYATVFSSATQQQ
jgi:hypothetical protein